MQSGARGIVAVAVVQPVHIDIGRHGQRRSSRCRAAPEASSPPPSCSRCTSTLRSVVQRSQTDPAPPGREQSPIRCMGCHAMRRPVKSSQLTIQTGDVRGLTDITALCEAFVAGEANGLLNVYVPHATAGLVILELGAGSEDDLMASLDRLLPRDDRWRHRHGSPGHGADHVLPLLAPPSLTVPVLGGRLALGTWQSIALLDPNADNAARSIRLSFIAGGG